jgi:signal peptidase II
VKQKLTLALSLIFTILVADIITKRWALTALPPGGATVDGAFGIPLTLAYNKGIAFGLDVPDAGRWILIVASVLVVVMLAAMFRHARPNDWIRLCSLSFVAAGALGNLIDRVRWERGVVDFIGPIDLGFMLWPIFNVADMAITTGACLLALTMWRDGSAHAAVPEAAEAPAAEPVD